MKFYFKAFLLFMILIAPIRGSGQTDFVYVVSEQRPLNLTSAVMNSQSYRQLPSSPFPLESEDLSLSITFNFSLTVSEPGPFLYVGVYNPARIFGFRRLVDGQLEPLQGFPKEITSIGDIYSNVAGLIWLEKHPSLPILYSVLANDGIIRTWRILDNGDLEEIDYQPIQIVPFFDGLQEMDISANGETFYLNSLYPQTIFKGEIDSNTGLITCVKPIYENNIPGRSITLSADDRFLFGTSFFTNIIQRFEIAEDHLIKLEPDFTADHKVVWLWQQGNLMVSGGLDLGKVSSFLIQEDGSLELGENSPVDVFSNSLVYAAFSPRGDRVFFGGNTYLHAFDLLLNGRLEQVPQSGLVSESFNFGISVAPELVGDPYSLNLQSPAGDTDPYLVLGDPATPFYLTVNGNCQGPFVTDATGVYQTTITPYPDQVIELRAYCDDIVIGERIQTVPTLSHYGLLLLTTLLLGISIRFHRNAHSKINNYM